jgi:hypothetical protein
MTDEMPCCKLSSNLIDLAFRFLYLILTECQRPGGYSFPHHVCTVRFTHGDEFDVIRFTPGALSANRYAFSNPR